MGKKEGAERMHTVVERGRAIVIICSNKVLAI